MLVGNGNGGFCRRTCGRCGEREDDSFGGGYDDDYFGDGGGEDEEDFGACACTEDGVSGGVDTDQIGCFDVSAEVVVSMATNAGRRIGETLSQYFGKESYEYAKYFGSYWQKEATEWAKANMDGSTRKVCYVKDPIGCSAASSSSEYIGAGWRRC